MMQAKAYDKAWVVNLLSQAFDANQSVNYIICQDGDRKDRIKVLMEYSFDICSMFGEIWLSDDRQACGMILYPERKKITFKSIWLDLKLILKAIGVAGIHRAFIRESKIKAKQLTTKMSYLWFIGVNPLNQKQGIGSKLLQDIIANAKQNGLPIYLETSTLDNLPWYEHFGFRIYEKLELGYTLYFLNNEPGQ